MSTLKSIFKLLLKILCIILLLVALFIGYLSISEYKPAETEAVPVTGTAAGTLSQGDTIRFATWNTGYGALGETADFFMDGGTHVETADEALVRENMDAIVDQIHEIVADILFLQETDRDSSRSHRIDETALITGSFSDVSWSFASNFLAPFVPYPVPPIGKVDSGILTVSSYPVSESVRMSLPCPFSWPIRTCNLKRCLLIDRIPVEWTDKELVAVNLHLEAYDDGAGKIAQTKMLREFLEEESAKGNFVIAGGDFNQTFSTVDMSAYPVYPDRWQPGTVSAVAFGLNWKLLMDETAPTCRSLDQPLAGADTSNFQYYMIDGFIVSSNLKVHSIETFDLGFVNSDHNPVVMEAELL